MKSKKLSRVQQALAAVQQESRQVAQDCQAEREKLLDDIRSLTKQIKLKVRVSGGGVEGVGGSDI